ncbi:AAA family ATPase [Sphingomonas sp. BGYR3]|uniref:chromosome segregation SMC family protein n=1 Tax=Sphingomonas sp. BGYR3 TaxID=2975483 RepID=UPI0021A6D56E|nr:AAA family ATPase [Sphingomonas sp. BGYR3]
MQIKRLRLTGFKSFVDPADLRIEPGLTGIVGPNGCGKSNLLEALRWTMGENSPRSMRGSGMEDVIFAGTASRPAREFAEVSLVADLDGGEEMEVVRRIERGAGSAYRINGRDVRAKDVALLFADSATGAHSPALVSQNRIGAIIAAKPAERRQMLEEAAGIAGLHVRRRDAEQKLRATEANLTRLGELIADQEGRIAQLRRQARQAEKYRTLSDQIRVAEARMIYARWRDAAAAADAARTEAKAAEALVAERMAALDAAAAHARAATDALATTRANALAAHDRAAETRHRLETLRSEQGSAARRLAEIRAAEERLAADRAREGALASDAAEAIARLTGEVKALEQQVREASARLPAMDSTLAEAERTARDAEVALAQILAAQASEAADIRVARAALAAAGQRLERAERDVARATAELSALSDAAPLEAERTSAAQRREAAATRIDAARTQLANAEAEERAVHAAREQAQGVRAHAHADLSMLDGEAAALRKATAAATNDRLLDRLTVADGFERALAAAMGDDLEAGLDPAADRHWAGADPLPGDPPPPAGATPLARHVDAPAALARRLAQILVVDEDAGQPLAVGQRLVTLAGAVRRWDGYVTRGGGAAAAERLIRVNRLRAIEAQRPAAEAALAAADAALVAIDQRLAACRTAIASARRDMESGEIELRDATRTEDRLSAQIERLAAQRADLAARQQRVAAEHGDARAERDRAAAALDALPDGSATAAQVALLSGEAEARRADVALRRAERATLDQAMATDRNRIAAASAERQGWNARAGEAARRITDMDARAAALADERTAIADRPDALTAEIDALADAYLGIESAAVHARQHERDAEQALAAMEQASRIAAEALAEAREARAGAAARAENQDLRRVEMGRLSGERFECPPPLLPERAGFDGAAVRDPASESAAHERLMLDRERIGPVNLVAESELAELEGARETSAAEAAELAEAVAGLRGSIGTLNREGRQRLTAAFEAVDRHFRRLFTTLFDGGQAHLELIDSDDPLEAGLEIMAQPPGKKLQSLTLLSGGEQALTAVALIFALFLTNPAPICVLDEVDAPLDDANIDRFCDLLDAMTRETRTRYLIVTHNAATMSRMHRLFGVTMVERGVSRLVSVDLGGASDLMAAE